MQGTNQLVRSNWGLGVLLRDTSTRPGWDRTGNPPTARRQLYLLSHIAHIALVSIIPPVPTLEPLICDINKTHVYKRGKRRTERPLIKYVPSKKWCIEFHSLYDIWYRMRIMLGRESVNEVPSEQDTSYTDWRIVCYSLLVLWLSLIQTYCTQWLTWWKHKIKTTTSNL